MRGLKLLITGLGCECAMSSSPQCLGAVHTENSVSMFSPDPCCQTYLHCLRTLVVSILVNLYSDVTCAADEENTLRPRLPYEINCSVFPLTLKPGH